MNVTKIKITKNRVSVDYDKMVVVDEKELVNKYSIDSPEHPTNAFKDDFQKMDFFLIELCELCGKLDEIPIMCDDVNITGLSFKYDEGALLGAIITGTKALAYSNSPLILNTPYKSVSGGEFDRMQHLTDPCIAALQTVVRHAKEYVDGKRLQVEIDLRSKEETTHIADPLVEGDGKVKSASLGPKPDVSRETLKSADDMAEDDWKLHPHNPDSPNFIGDAAIQQLDSFEESELPSLPDIED